VSPRRQNSSTLNCTPSVSLLHSIYGRPLNSPRCSLSTGGFVCFVALGTLIVHPSQFLIQGFACDDPILRSPRSTATASRAFKLRAMTRKFCTSVGNFTDIAKLFRLNSRCSGRRPKSLAAVLETSMTLKTLRGQLKGSTPMFLGSGSPAAPASKVSSCAMRSTCIDDSGGGSRRRALYDHMEHFLRWTVGLLMTLSSWR